MVEFMIVIMALISSVFFLEFVKSIQAKKEITEEYERNGYIVVDYKVKEID